MTDTQDQSRLLLAIDGLIDAVCLSSGEVSADDFCRTSLAPCIVTLPVRISQEEFLDYNSRSDPRLQWQTPWFPQFWSDQKAVNQVLDVLCTNVPSPVYWTIGLYERDEVERLIAEGAISANDVDLFLRAPKGHPKEALWIPVVARWTQRERIWLPENQGLFHFLGAAIAIFSGEDDEELRRRWIVGLQRETSILKRLLYEGRIAPREAVSFVAPYGDENREHAVIARRGWSPDLMLENMTKALGARLVRTRMTKAMFSSWELRQSLPSDVTQMFTIGEY